MFGRNRGAARRTARRTSRRTTRRVIRRTALIPGRVYRRRSLVVGGFSLLLVGGAAYKIGQAQAMQIHQYAGRPPEDLSQEELEKAMDALDINPYELNELDKSAIEAEAVAGAAEKAGPAASAAPQMTNAATQASAVPAYIAELQQLAGLRDAGIITAEDFEAKKKQLLGL